MAHQSIRVNLAASAFPFATELWGRSIMVPGLDENYERTIATAADVSKDKGVPQAFYMHNVMPTGQGYQAIGYDQQATSFGTAQNFNKTFSLQNPDGNRFLFVPANGTNYIYDPTNGGWQKFPFAAGVCSPINPPLVTVAFVNGQSFIFYEGIGCFQYDDGANTFTETTLAGITKADCTGICAANGYMIAFFKDFSPAFLYSNSGDPTDFVPSLITGAGGTDIQAIAGHIIAVLPIAGGCMVYCSKNIVAGVYTNNAEVPFNFNEVEGSAGITDIGQVSWPANLGFHMVWSGNGLLQVGLTGGASPVYPELTDFMAGQLFEDFDEDTLSFSQQYLTAPLNTQLTIVENAYMVLSYGVTAPIFTHAIVYDLTLQRFGKLKIPHVDCFNWNDPGFFGDITYGRVPSATYADFRTLMYSDLVDIPVTPSTPRTQLAFIDNTGMMDTVNFNLAERNNSFVEADGVILLGKYQLTRNKFITHQWTDVENVRGFLDFNCYVMITLDGKTLQPAVAMNLNRKTANSRRYAQLITGQNFSLLFTGAFNLTTVIIDVTENGDW